MEIRTHKILQWANNILSRKLATPINVIIQKDTRLQRTVQLHRFVLQHRRRRSEHHEFPKDKGASLIFPIPFIANYLMVRRFRTRLMRYRIGVDGKAVSRERPEAIWRTSLRKVCTNAVDCNANFPLNFSVGLWAPRRTMTGRNAVVSDHLDQRCVSVAVNRQGSDHIRIGFCQSSHKIP